MKTNLTYFVPRLWALELWVMNIVYIRDTVDELSKKIRPITIQMGIL